MTQLQKTQTYNREASFLQSDKKERETPSFKEFLKDNEDESYSFSDTLKEEMVEMIRLALLAQPQIPLMPPQFAYLNAQVQEIATQINPVSAMLFTNMVGSVCHVAELGRQETTFILDSEQFASSPFYGAKIVIEEFSTAPRIFNIQLIGHPEAVGMFQLHLPELVAAFGQLKTAFGVHLLEASYESDNSEGKWELKEVRTETNNESGTF